MTDFIGVYTKLRDPQISWEKKINIAQISWSDEKYFIPNKQQVLLDWVCQKLVDHILYNKKEKKTIDGEQISREVTDLWAYFKDILQSASKPVNREECATVPLTLMPQLVQVFAKIFLDHSNSEPCEFTSEQECDMLNIIHCGQLILSSTQFNTSFVAKFENYVMFMSSLLSSFVLFASVYPSTNHGVCNEMFHLLELSLSVYNSLQRRQTNHRKLFERTCGHILGPLLTVRYIVKNINPKQTCWLTQDKITSFVNLLHRTLSDALFRRENLPDYLSTLKALKHKKEQDDTTEPHSKRACIGNYTKLLFDTLRNLMICSEGVKQEAVMDFLPQLYVEFLKTRRENQMSSSSLEFDFFTELCLLLGVDHENMVINKHEKDLSRILEYIYCLLDAILTFDVYQVGEDNANDGRQLKWFVNFTELLLMSKSSFNVYPCLEVLLHLNHCILVPHLNIILQWMFDSDGNGQDHGCSCDSFLSCVVKTYVKLRQFDRLISQMLESLRITWNMNGTWKGFPDLVREELIKGYQSLPYGLSSSVWKTINSEICQHYLPALQGVEECTTLEHKQENVIFSLERVVGLFSLFLLNTTLGGVTEQHTVESTKKTLSSLYHGTLAGLLDPLWEILSNFKDNKVFAESLSVSVLVLFHALQDIKTFLGKLGCISDDLNIYWEKYIKEYLQKKLKTRKQGNERLKYQLVLVCIQRMRVILVQDRSAHCQTDFQQILDLVFSLSDVISYNSPSSWNKQVWTINKLNFPLAYWHCLCEQASLVLLFCSDQHRIKFTHCLIQSLISNAPEPAPDQTKLSENVLSMQSISKTLLQSAAFHLVPSMQNCIVLSLWNHIGELLSSCNTFTAQPHKRLVNIVTALGTLQGHTAVNEDVVDLDKEDEKEDIEDSENESVSTFEDEEDISKGARSTENSLSKAISPVLPLGTAFNSVLDELHSSKGLSYQAPEKDLETLKMITNCLSIFARLPLDWLTDVNHSACIIGLMACDTLLHSSLHQVETKGYHKALFLDHQLLNIMVNGCISKKRFIIHHVINLDSFLSWLMSSYIMSFHPESRGEGYSGPLECTSLSLICTLLKYLLRTASPSSVYSCTNKMMDGIDGLTEEVKKSKHSSLIGIIEDNKPLLEICGGVMDVLEKVIACKTSRLNEVRMSAKLAANMAPSLLNLLGAVTAKNDTKRHSITKGSSDAVKCVESVLRGLPVLVDSYSAVIHIYSIAQTSRKLSKTKEEFQQLHWRPILPSILTFAVNSLQTPQEDTTKNMTAKLKTSCLHFLDVLCLSLDTLTLDLPQGFHCSLLASLLSFLNKIDCEKEEDDTERMKGKALEGVLSLLLCSPSDVLVVLLKGLCNELTSKALNKSSIHRISTCIEVWSMILSGRFPKLRKKELCPVLPQVLMALQSILQVSTSNVDLIVLILQATTKLLSLGMNFIQSHHCTLVFHGILLVPLNDSKERFPLLFQAQYGLLSSILFHQRDAVYNSVHVFVTCVKNMLWSLGQHCNNGTEPHSDNELVCAEKMARLYQEIATHKTTFSKYAPYMITDYIQQIQQVSLRANVKEALVPGVYCLLDMCGEHEMALLHATLDKGSRELFNSLNNDYNKFHKFKGKV